MTRPLHVPVSFAVEGDTDEAVVRKMSKHLGIDVQGVFVRYGKPGVLKGLPGFNASAERRPWFVLVDLNGDGPCAGEFVRRSLPSPSRHMRMRVAIRAVEAWLLADRRGFMQFFGVRASDLPNDVEREVDPKRTVIDLARRSTKSSVRNGIPPRKGSGRGIGELYASLLIEFARDHWNVDAARTACGSLDRAVARLDELAAPC